MNISISRLVEAILKEEAAAAAASTEGTTAPVGPTVAQDGKTSIAYIPGGFKKKKKIVDEQRSELVHNLYNKLTRVMSIDFRENKQIKRTVNLLNYWLSLFKNSQYLDVSTNVAVNLGQYDKSVRDVIERIKNIYADDVGNLEMMINTIRQDRPLNSFEPWAECDSVAGVRVKSVYSGTVLILDMTVGLSMIPTQSIYIENHDVLDELDSFRTVKVVKDMVWPMGQMFVPSIFYNIKQIIDNLEEST